MKATQSVPDDVTASYQLEHLRQMEHILEDGHSCKQSLFHFGLERERTVRLPVVPTRWNNSTVAVHVVIVRSLKDVYCALTVY